MKDKSKFIEVVEFIFIIVMFLFACLFIYEVIDFKHDYECSNLPVSETFANKVCRKYWKNIGEE